jgi:hypothetical protein
VSFRAYDVVVGYSEVCFQVVANSEAEAVNKAMEMADFSPQREPFVCYAYTLQLDEHVYIPARIDINDGQRNGGHRDYWNTYDLCGYPRCQRPASDPLHIPAKPARRPRCATTKTQMVAAGEVPS